MRGPILIYVRLQMLTMPARMERPGEAGPIERHVEDKDNVIRSLPKTLIYEVDTQLGRMYFSQYSS